MGLVSSYERANKIFMRGWGIYALIEGGFVSAESVHKARFIMYKGVAGELEVR